MTSAACGVNLRPVSGPPGEPNKRRLPILGQAGEKVPEPDGEPPPRPPWHWTAIGVLAIYLVWLPLAWIVNAFVMKTFFDGMHSDAIGSAPLLHRIILIALNAFSFVLSSCAGAFLVTRFSREAGIREATLAGVAAASLAWVLTFAPSQASSLWLWALLLVCMIALGGFGAWLGARRGLHHRTPR